MAKVMDSKMLNVQRDWWEMAADENDEFYSEATSVTEEEESFDRQEGEHAPSQDVDVRTTKAELARPEVEEEEIERQLRDLEVCHLKRRIETLEDGTSAALHEVARLDHRLALTCTENARLWLKYVNLHLEALDLKDKIDDLRAKNAAPSVNSPDGDDSSSHVNGKWCCTGCSSENGADKWGIFFCKLSECPCCADSKGDYCLRCFCLYDVQIQPNEEPHMLEQWSGPRHARPMRPYTQRPYKWGSSSHLPPLHFRSHLQRPYVSPHHPTNPRSSGPPSTTGHRPWYPRSIPKENHRQV